jgi:beta-lactamase class A
VTPSAQAEVRALLEEAGLRGSFLVRDLDSGEMLGLDPDIVMPLASLAKLPLAVTIAERIEAGELDPAAMIDVPSRAAATGGPVGISRFRHPARVALEDLLYMTVSVSDNAAADELFALAPPADVMATLKAVGVAGMTIRHDMRPLMETPVERLGAGEAHLAHALAIGAGTRDGAHLVTQLDVSRTNTGTATACADLLAEVWSPRTIRPAAAARVRELLRHNVFRQRLAPDFTSDRMTWHSKTATLLNLRHEAGVVEHADGRRIAVVALSESLVPAAAQPGAEAQIAFAARRLHDELRAR